MAAALLPLLLGSAMGYSRSHQQDLAEEEQRRQQQMAAQAARRQQEQDQAMMFGAMGMGQGGQPQQPTGLQGLQGTQPISSAGPPGPPATSLTSQAGPPAGASSPGGVNPLMQAEMIKISRIPDPADRNKAMREFFALQQKLQREQRAAGAKTQADKEEEDNETALDNSFAKYLEQDHSDKPERVQRAIANAMERVASGDVRSARTEFDGLMDEAFKQGGTEAELAARHDYATTEESQKSLNRRAEARAQLTLDQMKSRFDKELDVSANRYEALRAKQDEEKTAVLGERENYSKMLTAVRDIESGNLKTGLIQQFTQIPTPEKENLKQMNLFTARRLLRGEWGESRPTDKDLELARNVVNGVSLTEEQNLRLLGLGIKRSEYVMKEYEARGRSLQEYEQQQGIISPEAPAAPDGFEGYVNPDDSDADGEILDMDEFMRKYGNAVVQ